MARKDTFDPEDDDFELIDGSINDVDIPEMGRVKDFRSEEYEIDPFKWIFK